MEGILLYPLFVIFSLFVILLIILLAIGNILDCMCAILFVYHAFIKKTKYFSTAFFYILSIGYAFDILSSIFIILSQFWENDDTVVGIDDAILYYSELLLGPWNTLMALNRFTAICFWKSHDWYWRNKIMIFAMAGMFGYPLLVSLPMLIQNPYCSFHSSNDECKGIIGTSTLIATISNGIHVIVAAMLGIGTTFASRLNIIAITEETKKFQQFLLIQSILSLFFYGCHLFYTLHGSTPDNIVFESIVGGLSDAYYVFFRVSSTLFLLFLSKTVRDSFTSFYKFLSCCCCCCRCCCKKKKKSKDKSKKTAIVKSTKTAVTVV